MTDLAETERSSRTMIVRPEWERRAYQQYTDLVWRGWTRPRRFSWKPNDLRTSYDDKKHYLPLSFAAGPPATVKGMKRSCGSCTKCCTDVRTELPEGVKPSGVPCPHLCSKGCGIYDHRPMVCKAWSCMWLIDPATRSMLRPDRSGYIVNPQLETCDIDGKPIVFIWIVVDPKRPDAHRDPALRSYLAGLWREPGAVGMATTGDREPGTEATFLMPPGSVADDWTEFTVTIDLGSTLHAQDGAS